MVFSLNGATIVRLAVYAIGICVPLFGLRAQALDCGKPMLEPIAIPQIRERINTCGIKTSRELMGHLPISVRGNFTFAYQSASKVGGCISPMSPRLLMWGQLSDFVIAFPWDPEANGPINCNVVEMFELAPKSPQYLATMIRLPRIESENSPVRFLRTAPTVAAIADSERSCSECHGRYFKPIWPQYSDWFVKGQFAFYGSNDDTLIDGTKEITDYRAFLKRIRDDGSAKLFDWKDVKKEQSLLSREELESDIRRKIQYDIPPYQHHVKENPRGSSFARPGLRFAYKLTEMHAIALVNRMKTHPEFEELAALNFYRRLNCDDGQSKRAHEEFPSLESAYSQLVGNVNVDADLSFEISQLAQRLGIHKEKPYASFNGGAVVTNYLAAVVALYDPELREHAQAVSWNPTQGHSLNPPGNDYTSLDSERTRELHRRDVCRILEPRVRKRLNL